MSAGQRISSFTKAMLVLGFVFLYAPLFSLMAFSFTESRMPTIWSGFSLKWYGELLDNRQMMDSAWISLEIAVFTAFAAVVLGTFAALVMTRLRNFRGKSLFGALITAPLVMPEVITGLSLLLLFVSIGDWFGVAISRGMTTIWIAHVTFTVAFVTVVISSRLAELDRSLEEAAMDLGASRLKVFFVITLPIISPALISSWLLAFTLSLDDVVLAGFLSGPGSTTLPVQVFSLVQKGRATPEVNALATLMILIVSLAALLGWWLMHRDEKKRQRDMQLALQQE